MIAKGGRSFVGLGALAAAVSFPFSLAACAAFVALTVFLILVFRDPERQIGDGIVSPADGTVREVDAQRGLVSIYLALRNVHVTRSPYDGEVLTADRSAGAHAPAFSKRTLGNERVEISLKTGIGEVSVIEMTGAIARRIVPYVRQGQHLLKGERMSLIRFGSRVDLFMPPAKVRIAVVKGQRVRAGVTRLAEVLDGRVD